MYRNRMFASKQYEQIKFKNDILFNEYLLI